MVSGKLKKGVRVQEMCEEEQVRYTLYCTVQCTVYSRWWGSNEGLGSRGKVYGRRGDRANVRKKGWEMSEKG